MNSKKEHLGDLLSEKSMWTKGTWKATIISLFLHGTFLFFITLPSILQKPSEIKIPKRILVQTVSLKKQPAKKTPLIKEAPRIEPIEEIAEEEPTPPQEEKKIEEEKAQEEKVEKEKSPPKEIPPEKSQKDESSQEEVSPPPKKESSKPQKVKPSKKAPQKSPPKKVAPPSSKKVTKKQETKKVYNEKLLQEALASLNKSKTASSKKITSPKGSCRKIGKVGSLHADEELLAESSEEGSEFSSSQEMNYVVDLIRRLQLHVRFPEPGEVQLKLTLNKNGTIQSLEIIKCKSQKIRSSINEKIHSVVFSPFGTSFKGESTHTFRLRLSNDLTWSCL